MTVAQRVAPSLPALLAEGLPDVRAALTAYCGWRIHSSLAGPAGAASRRNLAKRTENVFAKKELATSEVFAIGEAPVPRSQATLHEGTEMIREGRKVAQKTVPEVVVVAAADALFAPS